MYQKAILAAAIAAVSISAQAELVEETLIIGSKDDARKIAGSGAVIDSEQIQVEAATDINQLLKTVPGVYVREEDGSGLRPNIGIRGATSERSEKITLLEDGVMIAPAPYSNPAAYYFPTAMRMNTVEVLKGAPLLRYGPQTTGGVINMVSTAIPKETTATLRTSVDENSSIDLLANVGGTHKGESGDYGWLLETAQRDNEGYKDIDRSNRDTGFDIEDYLVKFGWEGEKQSVLFKAQYSEEVSNETYLGLTDADFDDDANRRYGLSDIDQMNNRHTGFNLTYSLELSDAVTATATGYVNEYKRDWFKLSGGGKIIDAANEGDVEAQGILDGNVDKDGLNYKHNNRSYDSKGVELNFDIDLGAHQLAVGGRVHKDEMDRFQPTEIYNQVGGELVYEETKLATGSNNREEEAEANTFWITDEWSVTESLTLNGALRFEDVDSERVQYDDEARTEIASERSNSTEEWLPGLSGTYDLNDNWQLLAGVHKGFSPLGGGAKDHEDPETSVNYEAGVRFNQQQWFVEAIGFYSDFDNKAENCSNANPCSNGDTSGSFVTGEAVISGVEFQLGAELSLGSLTMPIDAAYTYTEAEIDKDNLDDGLQSGDTLADVPENVFSLRAGLETNFGWDNYLVAKYVDEMCVDAGCNRSDSKYDVTEDLWVVDYISRYQMQENLGLYLKAENLFDEQKIVSRSPDGARPNKPRTVSVGLDFSF